MNEYLEAALKYASFGWKVIPCAWPVGDKCSCGRDCGSAAKHPHAGLGIAHATSDAETIKKWWGQWPQANIGIVFPGLILDVDPRHGGDESIKGKHLPITVAERTGGNGWHYLFKTPGDFKNKAIAPGLDLKGGGKGYIIACPSIHISGNQYQWLDGLAPWEIELAETPDWIKEAIKEPAKKEKEKHAVDELLQGAEYGTIDNKCTELVGHLVARGFTQDMTVDIIRSTFAQRCTREGRTFVMPDSDITRIVESVFRMQAANHPDTEGTPQVQQIIMWQKLKLTLSRTGHPMCNTDNVRRILKLDDIASRLIRYDEFKQRFVTTDGREWADYDTINAVVLFQRAYGLTRITKDIVFDALSGHAMENPINEPREWMDSLSWDGKYRIDTFFSQCLGASQDEYTRAVSRNFWINLAARIYKPGCRSDSMVVLEGKQGIGKTQALRIIGGPWYMDATFSVDDKDFFLALQGRLLIEISELDSFDRARTTKIKQAITNTIDRYRKPYGTMTQSYPRQCVFVGTTNEFEYLKDPTGARRFWPINCGKVDFDRVEKERNQLFAEAVAQFKSGATWHEIPHEKAEIEREHRLQTDIWEDKIKEFLTGKTEVKMLDILDYLRIEIGRADMLVQKRLATALRRNKWSKIHKEGGKIWVKTHLNGSATGQGTGQPEFLDEDSFI